MRKPFGKNNFDFVFSFFTSFGYFNSTEENNTVVKNISRSLRPGGIVLIDYLNVHYAEAHLIAVEEKEIDGILYHINRWSDEKFIHKHISIRDEQQFNSIAYSEQVAKFNVNDFKSFFEKNGLELISVFGNYQLDDYDEQTSERMILTARKK
jgi:SAM-dependent methyltransferase